MGKGKGKGKEEVEKEKKEKEGENLLGPPTFEEVENGRLRCVETGHEVPPTAQAKESYARAKHCRLGLIDAALARNKLSQNMFRQDPLSRMAELEQEANGDTLQEEENPKSNDEVAESRKKKGKKQLLKEAAKADKRGVCYLSRIPPHMNPLKLRQILSQYGEIRRIYLTPEDPAAQVHRKRVGGFRGQEFSEGWVEFVKKSIAKRVANMLNGEQIGGKKRSSFYYDIWNIKYLSKFKWDDLTEEIAYKNAAREQKLALEISAAKRERDFYLAKVDQSRALTSIEERIKKKQKVQQDSGVISEVPQEKQTPKVIRQFPQTRPVDNAGQSKPRLPNDILARVFGGS